MFILCYINSFLYLQIQLYDTFSISLLHVHWILCYRIKNISSMVFIKQLGLEVFFIPFFPPLISFLSLHCASTQLYARLWAGSCAFIWLAFLPWTSTINIPVVVYLAYGSTANFRFRGPIAKINISKEREGYGDRSGPRILEVDPVILKLSRFSQVQSERERT